MFNTEISQKALDSIDAFPDRWNQRIYHGYTPECGSCHCWLGWCEIHLGNYDFDNPQYSVSDNTRKAMGLTDDELSNFTNMWSSLPRLKALHKYFTERNTNPEAVYGIDGFDEEGYSLTPIEDFIYE